MPAYMQRLTKILFTFALFPSTEEISGIFMVSYCENWLIQSVSGSDALEFSSNVALFHYKRDLVNMQRWHGRPNTFHGYGARKAPT